MRLNRSLWVPAVFIVAVGIAYDIGSHNGSHVDGREKQRDEWAESLGHYKDGTPLFFATGVDLNVSETEGTNCRGTISFLENDGPLMQKAYDLGFKRIFCGSTWEPIVPRAAGRQEFTEDYLDDAFAKQCGILRVE